MNREYEQAIAQAKANLADLKERGADAIGESWDDIQRELFTPEEIAASNLRVSLIGELIKARQEKGISQKKLEELSGVKQPVIARMEKGSTSPQLDTILKVLAPLGKTLAIVPLDTAK
jgi:DNA-binding XRE family transcriptional regulator